VSKIIQAITPTFKEWDKSYSDYKITKFIAKNGDGHKGLIFSIRDGGKSAILVGLTGDYYGKFVVVLENNPDQWPIEQKVFNNIEEWMSAKTLQD
jgi:hypothetical protein